MSPPSQFAGALRLRGIAKSYSVSLGFRRREVLRGIDLELGQGEALGLVGPNGSGKSTLLRLIAGVERPSAGQIELLGGSPASSKVRRRVGFLPEESPFPRELRAQQALELIASVHGVPRVRTRAIAMLERVGLGAEARTPLSRYSRGMLRRFGLAQAVLHDPDLLLLDEPTAGLDAQGFTVLDELLADARRRGAMLVISSHLLADIHTHCNRLAVIVGGRIAAQGPPAHVLSAQGPVSLEIEGLSVDDLSRICAEIEVRGAKVVLRGPSSRALLELYRKAGQGER